MANQAIDNALITEFSDIVQVKSQQMNSRTRPYVRIKKMSGDIWAYDGIGDVEAAEIVGRNQPVTFQAIDHLRRKIGRRRFAVTLPIDASDLRGSLLNNSEYADAVVNAINRKFDRVVLDAMFADVLTGRDMSTTVTWASEGLTAVDATAGLTYAKLLEIKQNFIDNEVGNETPTRFVIGISGKEHTKLMQEVQLISGDYVPEYVADKGVITKAAGFDIIVFGASVQNPMLPLASTERYCFAMAAGPSQYGMVVGMSLDLKLDVSERKDLYETTQVQAIIELGAVRTEGVLVQRVRTTA
jgi:hypothetical protein